MKIETPMLKRLGPVPFWRGETRCLEGLEAIYARAAEKARKALAESAPRKSGNGRTAGRRP